MAIKQQTLVLTGRRDIVVRELTLEQALLIINKSKETPLLEFIDFVLQLITDTSRENLKAYSASEIRQLLDLINTVNNDFFVLAAALGMEKLTQTLILHFQALFLQAAANLFKQDM